MGLQDVINRMFYSDSARGRIADNAAAADYDNYNDAWTRDNGTTQFQDNPSTSTTSVPYDSDNSTVQAPPYPPQRGGATRDFTDLTDLDYGHEELMRTNPRYAQMYSLAMGMTGPMGGRAAGSQLAQGAYPIERAVGKFMGRFPAARQKVVNFLDNARKGGEYGQRYFAKDNARASGIDGDMAMYPVKAGTSAELTYHDPGYGQFKLPDGREVGDSGGRIFGLRPESLNAGWAGKPNPRPVESWVNRSPRNEFNEGKWVARQTRGSIDDWNRFGSSNRYYDAGQKYLEPGERLSYGTKGSPLDQRISGRVPDTLGYGQRRLDRQSMARENGASFSESPTDEWLLDDIRNMYRTGD